MKLGVFTVLSSDLPLEAALDRVVEAGLDCVEIGTGNHPGDAHCRSAELHALISIDEGFRTGVAFLRSVMPSEPALTGAWWT